MFINSDGNHSSLQFRQIFITDDSFKLVRSKLIFEKGFKYSQDYSNYGYIETQIPPDNQSFSCNPNSFHLWTHDDFHIIAMPNKNRTFTCNLFMPLEGPVSFQTVCSKEDFKLFMAKYFPELADVMVF